MKRCFLVLALVFVAACGEESPAPQAGGDSHAHDHAHGGGAAMVSTDAFGEPGDPASADDTVEVSAKDQLSFDPSSLKVDVGDTITFEVLNEGNLDHEFVLGDEAYQQAHSQAGAEMSHEGNGITLAPKAAGNLTWTFSKPGVVLYACHIDGHAQAGMVGRIEVR